MQEKETPDVLIVGAGIFGLSCAWACAGRGLRVTVLESVSPGAGASGGPVGAMSPHLPANWAPKKEFQLAALLSADAHWRDVAFAGGRDPGYARIGRLIPLADAAARRRAEAQAEAAAERWPGELDWTLYSRTPDEGWISPAAASHGVAFEPLSARIHPRHAVEALAAAVTARGVALVTGSAVLGIEDGAVHTSNRRFESGHVVLAAGLGGFDLVKSAIGHPGGRGVKGQAALFDPGGPVGKPSIFAQGIYVVPHAEGTVAVGSTSEEDWQDATETDDQLDELIFRARTLCPHLAGARLLERWAALRPRAPRPDPMVGPLPGFDRVFLATGAFKIGFGIAHAVGEAVADLVTGRDPMLPRGFSPADHGLPQRDVIRPISGGLHPA